MTPSPSHLTGRPPRARAALWVRSARMEWIPASSTAASMCSTRSPRRRAHTPAPGGGAQARLDANYALFATGFTPTSELGDAVRAHTQARKDALRVWRADHDCYNLVETPAEAHVAFPRTS